MKNQSGFVLPFCIALILTSGFVSAAEVKNKYPDLPKGLTSFGAAILDDVLYVYGGHHGRAHEYSQASQSNELLRLDLKKPVKWETISTGPRMQGLAMVAYKGKLFRAGGFTAHNKAGEKQNLESVADFAAYDPATKKWSDLPKMPVPRSSHDAVMIGDKLYVVGGWAMVGEAKDWHGTSYVIDLSNDDLKWQALPKQPFFRRALSAGHHEGKLFVIGGMQKVGKPTTAVGVFDPATDEWREGPKLIGEKGMTGFGSSAFTIGERLYVSTYDGNVQRLNMDGKSWTVIDKLKEDRFFHRMLPLNSSSLIVVGGASMQSGKRISLETIELSK